MAFLHHHSIFKLNTLHGENRNLERAVETNRHELFCYSSRAPPPRRNPRFQPRAGPAQEWGIPVLFQPRATSAQSRAGPAQAQPRATSAREPMVPVARRPRSRMGYLLFSLRAQPPRKNLWFQPRAGPAQDSPAACNSQARTYASSRVQAPRNSNPVACSLRARTCGPSRVQAPRKTLQSPCSNDECQRMDEWWCKKANAGTPVRNH